MGNGTSPCLFDQLEESYRHILHLLPPSMPQPLMGNGPRLAETDSEGRIKKEKKKTHQRQVNQQEGPKLCQSFL